jgi:hypothetical protein
MGLLGGDGWLGLLEIGPSERIIPLFTIEVDLDPPLATGSTYQASTAHYKFINVLFYFIVIIFLSWRCKRLL